MEADRPLALFDMDNTLYGYQEQLLKDMKRLAAPGEPELPTNLHDSESCPWLKARMDMIRMVPGWWRNLPRHEPGWEVLDLARKIGYEIEILTKGPRSKPHAWAEKAEAIARDFSREDDVAVNIVGKTKKRTYGRVLVDDYEDYVLAWLEKRPRGLVIMPAHDYNQTTSHPNVIRYDGSLESKAEVHRALWAAFERTDGEHWKDRL